MGIELYLPDTNILIYGLANKSPYAQHLKEWIEQKSLALSAIVVAEFLSVVTKEEEKMFAALLDKFGSLPVDTAIARIAAFYRKEYQKKGYKLRLPDCLVAATAKFYDATLVSFDIKDFPMQDIKKKKL